METDRKLLQVSEPSITKLEIKYVTDAVKSTFISGTSGRYIKEFEEGFAKLCGTKYAVTCDSGTAALQLAIRAAGIKPGDEVIVPTFTNIASLLCIIYVGAKPVLIDARPDTWCMDEIQLEQKITSRTKAIIPVHIYGHPVKMDVVMQIAKKHNLIVIEDAAEAHSGQCNNQMVGSFGDMACFSFYANKIITCFPAATKILIKSPVGHKGLSRMKNIEDIKIGEKVLSFDTTTSEKKLDTVTQIFKTQFDGELLELIFSNHNKITLTPNHPVFVIGKGWIPAENLHLDDEIIQYEYRGLAYREMFTGKSYEEILGKEEAERRKLQHSQTLKEIHAKTNSNYTKVDWVAMAAKMGKANLGKKHSQKFKEEASLRMVKLWENKEFRERQTIKSKEINQLPEMREKRRIAERKNALDPVYLKKLSVGVRRAMERKSYWENYSKGQNMKPNKQEKSLEVLINDVFPNGEYKYNGDFRLGTAIDRLIPDFVNVNGKKKIIELFGRYWHEKGEEQERISRYKKCGFECLIIWDNELQNPDLVKERIKTFTFNPNVKIVRLVNVKKIPFKGNIFNIETEVNHNYFAHGILVHNCGEGGMITTNNLAYADKMKSLKNLAFGDVKRYLHTDLGYNFRLTNYQAAMGLAQLQRINELVEKKREIASWYNKALSKVKGVQLPVELSWAKNVYWMYGIVLNEEFPLSKEELMAALLERGIDTRSFFVPMHQQPVFHDLGLFKGESYPVSERISRGGLYLPCGSPIKKKDVLYVCNTIKELSKR